MKWFRESYPEVSPNWRNFRFPGRGQKDTTVADVRGIVEVAILRKNQSHRTPLCRTSLWNMVVRPALLFFVLILLSSSSSSSSSSFSALPRGGPESGPLQFRWMTFRVNVVSAIRTDVGARPWLGRQDHHFLAV